MRRRQQYISLKRNHKGMTLIEVMVAMAVLAIVVTPTLRMFATSSTTNLRSKYRQRATTVGESVMESFKAYTMQNLCAQFLENPAKFKGVNTGTNGETGAATSMTVTAYHTVAGAEQEMSPFHVNGTLDQSAERYAFQVKGAAFERSFYDIEIDVTPRRASTLSFEGYDAYADAIINLQESQITDDLNALEVIDELKEKGKATFTASHASPEYTVEEANLKNLVRTIEVNISDSDTHEEAVEGAMVTVSGAQIVTLSISYKCDVLVQYKHTDPTTHVTTSVATPYTVSDVTYQVAFDTTLDESNPNRYLLKVYDNTATLKGKRINNRICKLDNVYLYFFPVIKDFYGEGCSDLIQVNAPSLPASLYGNGGSDPKGEGREPLNVFVVRQVPTLFDTSVSLSDASAPLIEGHIARVDGEYEYKVKGNIGADGKVFLYHNFGEMLTDSFTYTPKPADASRVSDFSEIHTLKEGLVEDVSLIYDIDIKIYEDTTADFDATNLLAEFTGTKNE